MAMYSIENTYWDTHDYIIFVSSELGPIKLPFDNRQPRLSFCTLHEYTMHDASSLKCYNTQRCTQFDELAKWIKRQIIFYASFRCDFSRLILRLYTSTCIKHLVGSRVSTTFDSTRASYATATRTNAHFSFCLCFVLNFDKDSLECRCAHKKWRMIFDDDDDDIDWLFISQISNVTYKYTCEWVCECVWALARLNTKKTRLFLLCGPRDKQWNSRENKYTHM